MKNILKKNTENYNDLFGRCKFVCDWIGENKNDVFSYLNIGCGHGWLERYIENSLKSSRIVGIEPTVDDIKTSIDNNSSNKVEFIVASGLNLPFEDKSFDICVCSEVLEHIPENKEINLFNEINRVLLPGGIFYLTTPNNSVLSKYLDPAWYLVNHRHYTVIELENFANLTNFQINEVTIKGGYYELIWILNLYISKWIFRRDIFFKNFFEDKINNEIINKNGFMTIYMKLIKKDMN